MFSHLLNTHQNIKNFKTKGNNTTSQRNSCFIGGCRFSLLNMSQDFETLCLEEMISCLMAGGFATTKGHVFQTFFSLRVCAGHSENPCFMLQFKMHGTLAYRKCILLFVWSIFQTALHSLHV